MESGAPNSARPGNGRYTFGPPLGQGGVAVVHRVRDQVLGRDVALKCLRSSHDTTHRARSLELFEREFHTLAQLVHPNVVAVHDYGVSAGEPYYTMELLDGGDLAERTPVAWRAACAIGRDVCSALSIIHSRRMVYRDISPRNIRCTSDGIAKLIDFGAMSMMGPTKFFIGTPAMSPPEAVHKQPLDARSDLYSLGATLYYALVGASPYPAHSVQQLATAWRTPAKPPSALVPGIPEALDSLVLELLELEPSKRPASAGEVMSRLAAIADLPMDEQGLVSRAYLTTPVLVGRAPALERLSQGVTDALGGSGGAFFVQGQSGSGRSRFLDASVLTAQMAGATVLRADATDVGESDYGIVRALVQQLLEAAPRIALESARAIGGLLAYVAPELEKRAPEHFRGPFDPAEMQVRLQPALRDWFLSVADRRPLVITVDDVHRVDAQSAGLLALLARAAASHPLLVVTSANPDEAGESSALNLIVEASRPIRIHKLSAAETEGMLRSVFGDVPHVQYVARHIHELAKGRPREIMQLAQHLVDRGFARYRAGTWSLPDALDANSLPANMMQAIRARVQALSPAAGRLAEAIALSPETRYSLEDCALLSGGLAVRDVLSALDELQAADIVATAGGAFTLARHGIHPAILEARDPAARAELHALVAELFERRSDQELHAVAHLLAAGHEQRAVELLVRQADTSVKATDSSPAAYVKLLEALPPNWLELYERGIALARQHGKPRSAALILQIRIAGIASISKTDATHVFAALFAQLRHDAGLDDYAALSGQPPETRLTAALTQAGQRFAQASEHERGFDPATAIRLLGRMVIAGVGSAGVTLGVPLCRHFPSLVPLIPLSPALAVAQQMAEAGSARVRGSNDRVHSIYSAIVQRLGQDSAGLDPTYQKTIRLSLSYVLGTVEAAMGLEASLDRARDIESSPLHEASATLLRMLYHLWQGDVREAERYKKRLELLKVERMRPQGVDGAHLPRELPAHTAVDDLTRVKETLDSIQVMAGKMAGWQPVLHWAKSEYERIRGDLNAALAEAEAALALITEDGHLGWADAAGAHRKTLLALGRVEEAERRGAEYLALAEQRGVGYTANAIRMPLAVALARNGNGERAVQLADAVIAYYRELGSTGLNPCLAHETRAKVALALQDAPAFRTHADLCHAAIPEGASGALRAKYERLMRAARLAEGDITGDESREPTLGVTLTATQIANSLKMASSPSARNKRGLELLLDACGARQGFLFSLQQGNLVLTASVAEHDLPANIHALARDFLAAEMGAEGMTTGTGDGGSKLVSVWTQTAANVYRPVLLCCQGPQGFWIAGLAVVLCDTHALFRQPIEVATELARMLFAERETAS